MEDSGKKKLLGAETIKLYKMLGAQNEVAEMAIKANAELEQVNARLSGLSSHYEQLAKRAERLKDEHDVQAQIVEDLQALYDNADYVTAAKYAEIVNSDGRYQFIGVLNNKDRPLPDDYSCRGDDIKAAVGQYLDELIPF